MALQTMGNHCLHSGILLYLHAKACTAPERLEEDHQNP